MIDLIVGDPYLLLTPALAAGVLALVRFVGCDKVLGLQHFPPAIPRKQLVDFAVDPANPPTVRNDYTGSVGMVIQPNSDVTLLSLGRWCSSMNSQAHDVKVVDGSTGIDVPGALVAVSLAGQPEQTFVFIDLPTPVKLTGGQTYYLVSNELTGADAFLEYTITVTPSADFQVPSAVYADQTPTPPVIYKTQGSAGNCYGPVNAQY
jgi:hypothetical protein